jgi:hypothetical protein
MRRHVRHTEIPGYRQSIWRGYAHRQQPGIVQKQGGNGIEKTQSNPWQLLVWLKQQIQRTKSTLAFGVARTFLARIHARSSVLQDVKRQSQSFGLVKRVINTHTTQPVFNLTVEGTHCFYANDVLVHNCDTVSQALLRVRQGGFIRLASDEKDDTIVSRRRAAYY